MFREGRRIFSLQNSRQPSTISDRNVVFRNWRVAAKKYNSRLSYLITLYFIEKGQYGVKKANINGTESNPCKGDFIDLIQADAQQIGVSCTFGDLEKLSKM